MWYVEYAPKVFDRHGCMVAMNELKDRVGYRSVYAFDTEAANTIKQSKASRGFKQFPVFADQLFMDFDTGDKDLIGACEVLRGLGIGYDIYNSGGKGFHCIVNTLPVFGINVPYTHRKLVEKLGIVSDPSIYRHSSLFRLPGTIHEKTSIKKELIESIEGGLLEFSLLTPTTTRENINIQPIEYDEDLRFTFSDILMHLNNSPGPGQRYLSLWKLSRRLCESGISYRAAAELMLNVNASWGDDKHVDDEVIRAVRNGYNE